MEDPQMPNEVHISVDIESNGRIPGKYSMCSLGASVVGEPNKAFYAVFQPISENVDPKTLEHGALSLEVMRAEGVALADGMRAFATWIRSVVGKDEQPVFVALNGNYDWMFVAWYFVYFLGDDANPFGIGGLEMKSYYAGMMHATWANSSSSRMDMRFQSDQSHTHNALDDAKQQGEMFQRMLAFQRERHGRDAR